MASRPSPSLLRDAHDQVAFIPATTGGLFFWRVGANGEGPEEFELSLGGAVVRTRGHLVPIADALAALTDMPPACSASAQGYGALVRLARELLTRGGVRPKPVEARGLLTVGWTARLDADERAVLAAIVDGMPAAAFAGAPVTSARWLTARAFLDAALDALVRAAGVTPSHAPESWEGSIEQGLITTAGLSARAAGAPRIQRSMEAWRKAAEQQEAPRTRLVMQLDPGDDARVPFTASFLVEARDPSGILGPVPLSALWAGESSAHVLADDLGPVRAIVLEALHRAGRLIAPIEATLASSTPTGARLTSEETWSVLIQHREALESAGIRLQIAPGLEGIADRFPKPQVRLVRQDGQPPESVSLAAKYLLHWQVSSADQLLTPAQLRLAGSQAPIAKVGDVWMSITADAAERLARVAERPDAEWTGSQALAAALAGEVRLPGDLSDAAVIAEQGLTALLTELQTDVGEMDAPVGLKAQLRHYQLRGLAWLFHRTRLGLGALLADDMGLGKTIQLIALLLQLRRQSASPGPTLIICPASVVGNWERELARFAPEIRVVRHHGGARHRDSAQLSEEAGQQDVVLTTYSLVRRDEALLCGVRWGTVVLDEAQNIKNPGSAQARAVRALPARRRVALSGTPVENRLTELWGLMEFLNPGLLGPLDRFRREIALPLERERDARALRWLRAATTPFMLRRMKTDPTIAPELPEKEIIKVYCSLTEEQAKLYKEAVDDSLKAIDSAEGIERSGRVLKLLTGLKQICNHPSHYLGDEEELSGRSGKLERAAEMLEEIAESGERALVFTQYVEMGNRLCAYLERRLGAEIPFFHGGLTLPARDAMVQRFQSGEGGPPILVLSLKAGGVGLNLTRATHVMHFDRWWNPAVEDQATDRAYRIGQTQRVQVHNLITIGTLEERIDKMLEDKRGLADAVVAGGEAWITQLSTDEIRALVSLGSDAAVESIESWDATER